MRINYCSHRKYAKMRSYTCKKGSRTSSSKCARSRRCRRKSGWSYASRLFTLLFIYYSYIRIAFYTIINVFNAINFTTRIRARFGRIGSRTSYASKCRKPRSPFEPIWCRNSFSVLGLDSCLIRSMFRGSSTRSSTRSYSRGCK